MLVFHSVILLFFSTFCIRIVMFLLISWVISWALGNFTWFSTVFGELHFHRNDRNGFAFELLFMKLLCCQILILRLNIINQNHFAYRSMILRMKWPWHFACQKLYVIQFFSFISKPSEYKYSETIPFFIYCTSSHGYIIRFGSGWICKVPFMFARRFDCFVGFVFGLDYMT